MNDVVVDTSAAMALLTGEPLGGPIAQAMETSRLLMSAATMVEPGIVLEARLGPVGTALVERFVRAGQIQIVEVDREAADAAIDCWRRYGNGWHQAGPDYGDCFVYALATIEGASNLCVGDDLASTDLEVVELT